MPIPTADESVSSTALERPRLLDTLLLDLLLLLDVILRDLPLLLGDLLLDRDVFTILRVRSDFLFLERLLFRDFRRLRDDLRVRTLLGLNP